MTQPPAVVVRSIDPVGDLQLHRLSQKARFHCVLCRRNKTQTLVATTNGDWAQTVCVGCYSAAARVHRQKAKSAAQQSELERLSGIDGLLTFLRVAGVDAKLVSGGALRINGGQTRSLAHLPSPRTLEWQTVVDELVLKYVGDRFIKAVEDYARFGEGLRALLRQRERGFAIMRGDVRLAIIHPTRAQIPHHEVIYANFLVQGTHWRKVADTLREAEPKLRAEWKREQDSKAAAEATAAAAAAELRRAAARRRLNQLPDDLVPELIDACLDASRRIRLERQVAYGSPVVLECDVGELRLMPIVATETRLLMPFQLNRGTEPLKGELILSAPDDPLPLLIGEDVVDEDAITAWTCALLGFADATYVEFEATARHESTGQRHPASSASHRRPAPRTLPRKSWPNLEPVGRWSRYSDSFVAGHRRRLSDGRKARDEARDRARQVGIILGPDETWVRPHARGIPDGIEMRFRWHAPTELAVLRA